MLLIKQEVKLDLQQNRNWFGVQYLYARLAFLRWDRFSNALPHRSLHGLIICMKLPAYYMHEAMCYLFEERASYSNTQNMYTNPTDTRAWCALTYFIIQQQSSTLIPTTSTSSSTSAWITCFPACPCLSAKPKGVNPSFIFILLRVHPQALIMSLSSRRISGSQCSSNPSLRACQKGCLRS